MSPFRCFNCSKLLGMIEGKAEIKCPKCKTMNSTDPFAGDIQIQVVDPITLRTNYDHESVIRMTRKEIEEKYGKK